MKQGQHVKIDSYCGPDCGVGEYLTVNKLYEVVKVVGRGLFTIIDDGNNELLCYFPECSHLGDGEWVITENEFRPIA
jgi:hypothetical protein